MRLCASCTREKGIPLPVGAYTAKYQQCETCQEERSCYSIEEPRKDDSFDLLGTVLSAGVDITLGIAQRRVGHLGGGGGVSGGGSSGDY